ncbi:MAG: 6-phosphogluconolactonase [Planctomycetota bacterium]
MNEPTYFPQVEDLHAEIADRFCELAKQCVAGQGIFRVSLSGGSTPKRLYEILATRDLPWTSMHFYWGDERNVPADHDESNQKMVREAMLTPANVPESNIHPVPVNVDDPASAASAYEATLREHFANDEFPAWDLALLGMGDDAHTASLFPGTEATKASLAGNEERWFVENHVEKFSGYRYTMTAPAINSAKQRWFLVSGENKREALAKVWADEGDALEAPSRLVIGAQWMVTENARP